MSQGKEMKRRREKTKPAGEVYALGTKRPSGSMGAIRSGETVFASAGALKLMRLSSEESQPIVNIDATKLVREVNNAYDPYQPNKVQQLLLSALAQLKAARPRVPSVLGLALCNVARQHPEALGSTSVVEHLLTFLKRETNGRGSRNVHVLVCNLLMVGLRDSNKWPPSLVKLYAEDCLGDRSWVDRDETRLFVRNIETAFPNAIREIHRLLPVIPAPQTPQLGIFPSGSASNLQRGAGPPGWEFIKDWNVGASATAFVRQRYDGDRACESAIMPLIREHMQRRIGVDNHQRSLIRLMTMCAGIQEVRTLALQKLDPWLQMQKLHSTAVALMKSVCANCSTFSSGDKDVIAHVMHRLRKLVTQNNQYYLDALRMMANAHESNLPHMLGMVVSNETGPTRNKNNIFILPALVNFNPKAGYESLGDIFHDLICQNDVGTIRNLRQTYREICKWFKFDIHFVSGFADALLKDRSTDPVFVRLERGRQETYVYNLIDIICVIQMNCAYHPSVRDAFLGKRDAEPLRAHYAILRRVRQSLVRWFHSVLPRLQPGIDEDHYQALMYKALFLTNLTDDYFHLEPGWPPEADRHMVSSLCGDSPLTDSMVIHLLDAALNPQHPLSPCGCLDILLVVCQRASRVNPEVFSALKMKQVHDVIELLYEACKYPHPLDHKWPPGYIPPTLMDRNLYWKVTLILVLLAANNLDTLGQIMWKDYDTVRSLMEMLMTNNFEYPPHTLLVRLGMTAEDFASQERTVRQQERNIILDYESKLKLQTVSEESSELLSIVGHYLPKGPSRAPMDDLLACLKEWNSVVQLGRRLCTCREFLLELIQIQRSAADMPDVQSDSGRTWLVRLVEESSEASLALLPIQCLSEYLIFDVTLTDMDQRRLEKQMQLVGRLRSVASLDPAAAEVAMEQVDMLQPFVDRLTWESERARYVARCCLRQILCVDHSVVDKGHPLSFLVNDLPTLACYQSPAVRDLFNTRIHRSILIETDQPSVESYLTFLYDEASREAAAAATPTTTEHATATATATATAAAADADAADADAAATTSGADVEMTPAEPKKEPETEEATAADAEAKTAAPGSPAAPAAEPAAEPAAAGAATASAPTAAVSPAPAAPTETPIQGNPWSSLVDTLTRFLLSRPILFQSILQSNVSAVRCMMDIFLQHLIASTGQQSAVPVEEHQPLLVVTFDTGHCALSLHTLHAQLFLLSQAALRRELAEDALFQRLLSKWFLNELGEMNHMEIITPRRGVESEILPDYLKPHLLRSGVPSIVNKVTTVMSLANILELLPEEHCYSFPSTVMNIILHRADHTVNVSGGAIPELSLSRPKLTKLRNAVHNWLSSQAAVQYGMSFYRYIYDTLAAETPQSVEVVAVGARMALLSRELAKRLTAALPTSSEPEEMEADPVGPDLDWLSALEKAGDLQKIIRSLTDEQGSVQRDRICADITQKISKRDGAAWFEKVLVGKAVRFMPLLRCLLASQPPHEGTPDCKLARKLMELLKKRSEKRPLWASIPEEFLATSEPPTGDAILPLASLSVVAEGTTEEADVSHLGALIDWLTLVDPESEESCQSGLVHNSLFVERGGNSQPFLAHRLYRCNLSSLQQSAEAVLTKNPATEVNMDSTRVLDFIQACIDHPRLQYALTGASPVFPSRPALQLSPVCVEHLLEHAGRELAGSVNAGEERARGGLSRARSRVRLVLRCCAHRVKVKESLVTRLAARAAENATEARQLLLLLYSECPALLTFLLNGDNISPLTPNHLTASLRCIGLNFLESDEIAVLGRNLLCSLLNTNDTIQEDASMACRSLACHHPLLFCRHLPLMSGLLHGRLDGTWTEFRRRNYHLLFSYVIHIVELLSPHCYRTLSAEKEALDDILRNFMLLLQRYRNDKSGPKEGTSFKQSMHLLKPLADKLSRVLLSYHRLHSSHFAAFAEANRFELRDLADHFASLAAVNAAAASSDASPDLSALDGAASATKMAPFVRKLRESADQQVVLGVLRDMQLTSKRKPEILDHFVVDLQNLLSHHLCDIRELAFNLLSRYLNKHPECAFTVLRQSFLPCLSVNSKHPGVTESALKRLPEMMLLAPRLAPAMLRAAAHLAVVGSNPAALATCADLINLANLETLLSIPSPAPRPSSSR